MLEINYKIDFNPSKENLFEIEQWLIDEENKTKLGFYCSWGDIQNSFDKNQLVVLLEDEIAIGFITYSIYEVVVTIWIAEIKPNRKKRGLGHLFLNEFSKVLKKKRRKIIELYCSPISSEKIWRKLNFKNFPPLPHETRIWMYRTLVPSLENTKEENQLTEVIELWEAEPYQISNQKPRWIWEISYKNNSNKLSLPIIKAAYYKWQLCWRIGDTILFKNSIDRFTNSKIEYGNFLIITELHQNRIV